MQLLFIIFCLLQHVFFEIKGKVQNPVSESHQSFQGFVGLLEVFGDYPNSASIAALASNCQKFCIKVSPQTNCKVNTSNSTVRHDFFRCAYVLLLMSVYWVFEALPLAVTSLIPVALLPLLGIMSTGDVTVNYMKGTSMLFVGSRKKITKTQTNMWLNFHTSQA